MRPRRLRSVSPKPAKIGRLHVKVERERARRSKEEKERALKENEALKK